MAALQDNPAFVKQLESRVKAVYQAFKTDGNVPPAIVFRLEGFIEAGCALGLLTEDEAQVIIKSAWQSTFTVPFPELVSSKIAIPTLMQRAPVYPSGKT